MPKLLVLAATALVATVAFACGDKLMLLPGSARFHQVFGSSRPALILAYARGNSAVPGVVKEFALKPALKQSGYKLSSVDDPAKLDEALRNGKYDRAFRWLRKSTGEREEDLALINVDPRFDPLRADPRFTALLRSVGLAR